jgi:hypothetical protein
MTPRHPVWFFDHGIGVFPLVGKHPACKSWDDYIATREEAARFRNYGVRLRNRDVQLGVLDSDTREAEVWVLQQIVHRAIPDTPLVVETARGFHRYYRLTGLQALFIHRDGLTIEFKNGGQYVVGPGSIHPGDSKAGIPPGKKYCALNWSWRLEDIPFFPSDFVFDDRPPRTGDGYAVPEALCQSERHDGLYRIMRSLAARGVPLDGALAACRVENRTRCQPPLPDDRDLDSYLRRAYHQSDTAGFTRTPQTGWELAGGLLEIGLSVDATLVAVRSITPDFDPRQV